MAINLTSISNKLKRLNNTLSWKMHVKLPSEIFIDSDFDTLRPHIHSALTKFWNFTYIARPAPNPAHRIYLSNVIYEFKIILLLATDIDQRDQSLTKDTHDATVQIAAQMISTIAHKENMLIDHPVELRLTGKLFRSRDTHKVQSVQFNKLLLANDAESQVIAEV